MFNFRFFQATTTLLFVLWVSNTGLASSVPSPVNEFQGKAAVDEYFKIVLDKDLQKKGFYQSIYNWNWLGNLDGGTGRIVPHDPAWRVWQRDCIILQINSSANVYAMVWDTISDDPMTRLGKLTETHKLVLYNATDFPNLSQQAEQAIQKGKTLKDSLYDPRDKVINGIGSREGPRIYSYPVEQLKHNNEFYEQVDSPTTAPLVEMFNGLCQGSLCVPGDKNCSYRY